MDRQYNIPERAFSHKISGNELMVQVNVLVPVTEFKMKKRLVLTTTRDMGVLSEVMDQDQKKEVATKMSHIDLKRQLQFEIDRGSIDIDGKVYKVSQSRIGGIAFDSGKATNHITHNTK